MRQNPEVEVQPDTSTSDRQTCDEASYVQRLEKQRATGMPEKDLGLSGVCHQCTELVPSHSDSSDL